MTNTYAIVPARGGSTGIRLKNLQEIDGRPLVGIAAEQAMAAEKIDVTVVNSDHEGIRKVGDDLGALVMDRPDQYAHDDSIQEVDRLLVWCVEQLEEDGHDIDIVVLIYPTAPLREVDTIDQTIDMIESENFDSVLSLYEDDSYLWAVAGDGSVKPTNYDPAKRGPRQKEDWNQWVENKAVYAMKRDLLMETGCRLGGKIGYVKMPKWRSIDIDRIEDLELARYLWHNPLDEC